MRNLCIRLHTKTIPNAKERIRRAFSSETGGAGIIAAVILVVIVISLALLFRDKISTVFHDIWGENTNDLNFAITARPGD